ncbi:MAG: RnfABCDGE type electron transport complex subunit D [Spirochaetaceae bacterium]|nr:RnfABCDGE type electron transport complex subunit D [Spirochaetaceae bacterium]
MTKSIPLLYQKPQVNLGSRSVRNNWMVAAVCFACVMQSAIFDSARSLAIAFVSCAGAIASEFFISLSRKTYHIADGSAVCTALIFTLLLPNNTNPVVAILGSAFAIAVVKQCFGGLGSNWLNPALGGWLFVRISWPGLFSEVSEFNPALLSSASISLNDFVNFSNLHVLSYFNAEISANDMALLFQNNLALIADRGVFVFIIGSIVLLATRSTRAWRALIFLASYILTMLISGETNLFYYLFSGGLLLIAFVITADPATGAKSIPGIIAQALLTGVLAFVFRFFGKNELGIIYAALLVNGLMPLIRSLEDKLLYRRALC